MTVWNDTDKETLTELWGRKPQLSARQIGEIMGFGRNAIIGAAHRLKLPSRKKVTAVNLRPVRKPKTNYSYNRVVAFRRPPVPKPVPAPIVIQEPVEPIPFSSRGEDTCRAITRMGSLLYSSESMYCGAPRLPGKAWCQHHFDLYTEKRTRR